MSKFQQLNPKNNSVSELIDTCFYRNQITFKYILGATSKTKDPYIFSYLRLFEIKKQNLT